ncbi:DedA family protein [Tsukamurella soli]|uniref:DedA family protein n=1 Tax=Tsukamurella soli TaxID=644556 RepID=A0ABP8KID5_9ACTN
MTGILQDAGPVLIYLIVAGFVLAECGFIIGLFLPGDSLLLTAGVALATSSQHAPVVWGLAATAMVAAITGNHIGYRIGATMGDRMLAKKGGRYFNAENLHRVKKLMDRHGFLSVLVARWVPWVRTLCPMVAGAAAMDKRKYTIASVIGSVLWAPCLLLVGYYGSSALGEFKWILDIVLVVMVVALLLGTIVGVIGYRREMARPDEQVELDPHEDPPGEQSA